MGRLLIQFPGTTTAKALTETLSKNVIIVDEDLHQLRLHDGSTAGGHLIGGSSGSGVPVGTIIPFAGNSIPQGYLLCDGSAISRTTYASLFAVIGTIYGAGDGNSTFNLPNMGYCVPMWRGDSDPIGHLWRGSIPNITGSLDNVCMYPYNGYGAFWVGNSVGTAPGPNSGSIQRRHLEFNASWSNGVYNSDNTGDVFPINRKMYQIIKY